MLFVLEELGRAKRRGDRWLFSGQRTDGWMDGGLLNHPGGLRNANFGCQVGTSRGVGRGKVREREWHREEGRVKERRKEAREKGRDTFFAPLSLSFHQISSSTEFFGFASKSLRERCLAASSSRRFDPTFLLSAVTRWISGRVTRSQPLVHPRKSCGGLDLSSLERERKTPPQRFYRISYRFSPIAIPVAYRNEDL